MRPLTILALNNHAVARGGADRYFLDLTALLRERGHRVFTLSATLDPDLIPRTRDDHVIAGIDTSNPSVADTTRFFHNPGAARVVDKILKNRRIDVSHLHIHYGQLTPSIFGPLKRAGVPIVQTVHEYRLSCPISTHTRDGKPCHECTGKRWRGVLVHRCNRGSLLRSLATGVEYGFSRWRGTVRNVDRFITVSHHLERHLIATGIPASRVRTVHNFTDPASAEPADARGSYFLYFGRLERIKGLFTLLKASSGLPEIPLLIAGRGEAETALRALVDRSGWNHVRFLGFLNGPPLREVIRGSIGSILPSEWPETFGLTLLETFAHARPVIGSHIGGIPEVISGGENGFLVEPGNVDQLRARMALLAANPDRALEMGRAGRRTVEEFFGPERHYRQILDVYREMIR